MLALLTILAMFAFVFIPILMQGMGGSARVNPVVIHTSKYGDLPESEVAALRQQRSRVLNVLSEVMQESMQGTGISPTMVRQWLESRIGPATEESVVNGWLLAREAEKLGMVISNNTVNSYLKLITNNALKSSEFQVAFKRSGMSELQFFDAMRDVLATMQLENMFHASTLGVTPVERWEYFTRVKQQAILEAVAVPVANYVSQIDDPKDENVLKAFFEEHKDQYARPDSATPGFHKPQQVALEFLKADYDKFTSAAAVTDEEIQKHYEKNKELYDKDEKKADGKDADKTAGENAKETKKDVKENSPKAAKDAKDVKPSSEEKKSGVAKGPAKSDAKPAVEAKTPPKNAKPALADATKKRIRQELAFEKIQKVLDKLRAQTGQYHLKWSEYEVAAIHESSKKDNNSDQKAKLTPPTRPDFEKLAKENGLTAGHTALLPQWAIQQTPGIGSSLVGGRYPVSSIVFTSLPKFRGEISEDMKGNLYLFWKTEETKDRVPEFTDKGVREEVLRAWKMQQAQGLALKAAKSLAAEAGKSGKTLKKAFADQPDVHVILPPSFSWLTFGSVALGSAPNAARISNVAGVDMPGNDFMREVFHLEPGQVGTVFNATKTIVYVIRPTEFTPSYDVLWKQFEVDDFSKYASVGEGEQRQLMQGWLADIQKESGFEWKRKQNRAVESGPSSSESNSEQE
jgi:hypothetical protein